jgi:hypothetical protein
MKTKIKLQIHIKNINEDKPIKVMSVRNKADYSGCYIEGVSSSKDKAVPKGRPVFF